MLKIPPTLPVRTRVPLATWAIAAVITLDSLMSSLLQMQSSHHAMEAEQPAPTSHHAKV
ncbi:MAG TPA: hypothetical protein VFR71_07410 [Methyloceanibacter sp.]|nr:hypothetical protein [Methyloceanibacter sp.]